MLNLIKKSVFKKAFLVFMGAVCFSSVWALTLEDVVGKEKAEVLRNKGSVQKVSYKEENVNLDYLPQSELTSYLKKNWPEDKEEPSMVIENCYVMKKAELGKGDASKVTVEEISKIVRSISKMEGMKYFSSKKKWEVLYHDCYRIDGPESEERIPDDTNGSAEGIVQYCHQNDNSLGKTNYRLEYHQTENEVSANFVNTTPVSFAFIKAVEAGNLHIGMHFVDCGDEVLVYLLTQAKFPAMAILEKKMNETFSSRLNAIYNWFINQF